MDEQVFQKVNHPVDGGEVGRYSTDAGPVHHMALIIILRYTWAYMYIVQYTGRRNCVGTFRYNTPLYIMQTLEEEKIQPIYRQKGGK